MTEAFHQHLKELIKIFKHIEPDKGKLRAKMELMLEKAYRLQNRTNGLPFVPATRGEWNILYFNPDLLEQKFIEHKQKVYVARLFIESDELIKQNLLNLSKKLENQLILRDINIKKLLSNSLGVGLLPRTPESISLPPRTPDSERKQKLRKQLEESNKIFLDNALERANNQAQNQKLNKVSKEKEKTITQLVFENNTEFDLNLKKYTSQNIKENKKIMEKAIQTEKEEKEREALRIKKEEKEREALRIKKKEEEREALRIKKEEEEREGEKEEKEF
jgi:hypothetical protein